MLYCFYSYNFTKVDSNPSSLTLRSLLAQIIRKKSDLLPHVYESYVKIGGVPSASHVSNILKDLFRTLDTTYLVLDGLDECDGRQQKQILKELSSIMDSVSVGSSSRNALRIFISSRETREILSKLRSAPQISLTDEHALVSGDIAIFAKHRLTELRETFNDNSLIDKIEETLVQKADGKPMIRMPNAANLKKV